jgi:DNA polymerase-1
LLAPLFDGQRPLISHNQKFELSFLAAAGLPVPCGAALFDTMLAAQLLGAGTADGRLDRSGLAAVCERFVGQALDKTEQRAAWAGPLSDEMLAYAATDAAVLLPLADALRDALQKAGLERTAALEMRALPAVAWLERAGAPFDAGAWRTLSDAAVEAQVRLEHELTALAGVESLFGKQAPINLQAPEQIKKLLAERGHPIKHADEATLKVLAGAEPLAELLLQFKEACKRVSTYGLDFLKHVHPATGRIHADYLQLGAASGRMSCRRPNLQNIPRDPRYRACFRPPEGRALVKADYSQIELRIAAQLAPDRRMLEAYRKGEDLHALTAEAVLGRANGAVTPEDRQAAKALNFGLLYGMGVERFRETAANEYGVVLTAGEAERFRDKFFRTYAGLRAWPRRHPDGLAETRTLGGRRRLRVAKFTEKLNTPVQGTGADGLKDALALLWETRDRCPGAVPVLCVHHEIVVECDAAQAEHARAWLEECMVRGMGAFLTEVPVVVESKIIRDWSGTEV